MERALYPGDRPGAGRSDHARARRGILGLDVLLRAASRPQRRRQPGAPLHARFRGATRAGPLMPFPTVVDSAGKKEAWWNGAAAALARRWRRAGRRGSSPTATSRRGPGFCCSGLAARRAGDRSWSLAYLIAVGEIPLALENVSSWRVVPYRAGSGLNAAQRQARQSGAEVESH